MTLEMEIQETPITLQFWDSYEKAYHKKGNRGEIYSKKASVAVFLIDVSHHKSTENFEDWKQLVIKNSGVSKFTDLISVLVATKIDKREKTENCLSTSEIDELSVKYGNLPYFELSAKTGNNVKETFVEIAKMLYEKYF